MTLICFFRVNAQMESLHRSYKSKIKGPKMLETSKGTIYSIGYSNRTLDAFCGLLDKFKVKYLVDVRSRPYSKYNPDFNKVVLENHFKTSKIRYVFMGDQIGGLPEDPTCFTDGKVDYDKCKLKELFVSGITRLIIAYGKGLRVAVMCSEGKPQDCHRSKLLGEMLRDRNIEMQHIDENGNLISQIEVISKIDYGQQALFEGASSLTSRKRHLKGEDI
jgi:uncharacterized protein (DUF488 family)